MVTQGPHVQPVMGGPVIIQQGYGGGGYGYGGGGGIGIGGAVAGGLVAGIVAGEMMVRRTARSMRSPCSLGAILAL